MAGGVARDAIERVVWTAVQAGAGAAIDALLSGQVTPRAIGYAVAIAVLKVIVAPHVGRKGTPSIP